MANVTLASNSGGRAKTWKPYSHEPLYLGSTGTAAPDGTTYVTQTTGSSGFRIDALCIDEYNCDFYYELTFSISGISRCFYVNKYSLGGTLVDTIYASDTSGDGRFWAVNVLQDDMIITIDIGVVLKLEDISDIINADVIRINMPSSSTMRARRLYHGGYTTYIRMPEKENKAYRSDIIPTSLLNRNITLLSGMASPFKEHAVFASGVNQNRPLLQMSSLEAIVGNSAVTIGLEWNIDPQGAETTKASGTNYEQVWAEETWQMGTFFAFDVDPIVAIEPVLASAAYSDATQAVTVTNRNATTMSGRAGHARIKYEFMTGLGSTKIHAFNQWFPTTIILG